MTVSLPSTIHMMYGVCPNCHLAMTAEVKDMKDLGMRDFVCSDFLSRPGDTNYPPRDCDAANSLWAAAPSARTSPCCTNSTLVTASIMMMARALVLQQESLSGST
jgi:hypothetical protein